MTPARAAVSFALVLALAAAGCNEESKHASLAPAERSQVIESPAAAASPVAAATSAAPAPPAKPRAPLCGGALEREGRPLSKKSIGRRAATGVPELPAEPSFGSGFTWVNFWAAWCVPCKEEIPRLLSFESRLKAAGKDFHVVFVSLDDDERQLEKFLTDQGAGGLRATYWLREGHEREDWLLGAGVDPDPDLPAHIIVDGKGRVRCKVRGAIEDADYPGLLALLGP